MGVKRKEYEMKKWLGDVPPHSIETYHGKPYTIWALRYKDHSGREGICFVAEKGLKYAASRYHDYKGEELCDLYDVFASKGDTVEDVMHRFGEDHNRLFALNDPDPIAL